MRQIFLDTETTGLSAEQGDRMIEIGCVEFFNRKPTGNNLHFYLKVDRESHPDALRIHGITSEFLKDKPTFDTVVQEFLSYVRGAEVLIHNASFDVGFINAELHRVGHAPLAAHVEKIVDTLTLAREMFAGKRNSLDALCSRFGVDNSSRTLHGALLDAELLAEVYIHMTRGQDALLVDAADTVAVGHSVAPAADLSQWVLPVLAANAHELSAHEQTLTDMLKAAGGKVVWRDIEQEVGQGQGQGQS